MCIRDRHRIATVANVHIDVETPASVDDRCANVWLLVRIHPYRPAMEAHTLERALFVSKILPCCDRHSIDHGLAAQAFDRCTADVHEFHSFENLANKFPHFGKDFAIDRIVGDDVPVMQPLIKSFEFHPVPS